MKKNSFLQILPFILFALLLVDFYVIFIYAPEEKTQGLVQKIFYFHVSSAFMMYLGFGLSALGALLYLWKRSSVYDALAQAGATTGLLFCTMVLMSGPIWAKPIWGTWWTWDPRLTTTFLIWLVFVATVLLRRFYGPDPRGKIFVSLLTLLGVLDIPLIFFSVKLWRAIHPSVLGEKGSMPFEMHVALMVTSVTVFFLFCLLFFITLKVNIVEAEAERLYFSEDQS